MEREGSLEKHMEVSGKRKNSPLISKQAVGKAARSHRQNGTRRQNRKEGIE